MSSLGSENHTDGQQLGTIALVCSEPLRANVAGVAIRYVEMARHLANRGHPVRFIAPVEESGARLDLPQNCRLIQFERGCLREATAGCSAVVGQGQLVNDVVLEVSDLPVVVDLYDPWLVENLHYAQSMGLDPYRNDHATWMLQLSRGDLFLCSSQAQRLFVLGLLTALGRVNPESMEDDPSFEQLVRIVPFGVPEELPAHDPVLPARSPGERRLLFGGLYDWYDPLPVLEAVARGDADWRLLLVRNPNPAVPQSTFREAERWAKRRGLWEDRISAIDWVPYDRRYDLLRDVDLLISTHRRSLETDLSFRTRFLDALAVGCPIVSSAGGAMSDLLERHRAGWVAPVGNPQALGAAIREALAEGRQSVRVQRGEELAASYTWARSLEPLSRFCARPHRELSRLRFTHSIDTVAPVDSLVFRIKRRLRRLLGGEAG